MKKKKKSRQETLWIPHDAVASILVILFMRNSSGYFERKSLTRLWSRNARRITRRSKVGRAYRRVCRMLLIGYFERIDSERGICWRCSDSLSLRQFLGLGMEERTPDHSSLGYGIDFRWKFTNLYLDGC